MYYLIKTAQEFWTISVLKNHLRNHLFEKQGALPNNFEETLLGSINNEKVLRSFSDHYLLAHLVSVKNYFLVNNYFCIKF